MSSVFDALQLQRIAQAIEDGYAGGGTLTVDVTGAGDMQGATAGTGGVHGLVPAPQAGDEDKVLTGAGTWETPAGGGWMPDYSTAIDSGSYMQYDGLSYTATVDCIIYVMLGVSSGSSYPFVEINGTRLGYMWSASGQNEELMSFILKAGDTLEVTATNAGSNWQETYTVFALN